MEISKKYNKLSRIKKNFIYNLYDFNKYIYVDKTRSFLTNGCQYKKITDKRLIKILKELQDLSWVFKKEPSKVIKGAYRLYLQSDLEIYLKTI